MQNKNKDITPINDKRQAHGYWEIYLNDKLWYKRFLVNGEQYGFFEYYHYKLDTKGYCAR